MNLTKNRIWPFDHRHHHHHSHNNRNGGAGDSNDEHHYDYHDRKISLESTKTTHTNRHYTDPDHKKFWLLRSLKEFCLTTDLHGFNYIFKEEFSIEENRIWAIIMIIAVGLSIFLLWSSWNWSNETLTVTVIESTHFPTWNVRFPAVSICNFNKISKQKAYNLAKRLRRPTHDLSDDDLANNFRIAMYYTGGYHVNKTDYIKLYEILTLNKMTLTDLIEEITPTCNEILLKCKWKGTQTRCDALFQKVNSTEGICCSFNYYGLRTNNYPVKLAYTIPKSPRRVTACGYQSGLTVLLQPGSNDYFGSFMSSYGFRVLLHDSYDYPDENSETKVLTALRESFLSVTPESTYATDEIRSIDIHERNCLFYDEKVLDVMQSYSYLNCLSECRSKLVYEKCGCVPLNLPHNRSLPTCNLDQIHCVVENRNEFVGALPGSNESILRELTAKNQKCDCLPDCELNQYPAEITSGILNRKFSRSNVNLFKDVVVDDQVLLHVFFNDLISTRYRRDIYQNWLTTLAAFGGLLGLILGFSIVTAFEFFYYVTLRPIFNFIKTGRL